jgi:hypothetical protein
MWFLDFQTAISYKQFEQCANVSISPLFIGRISTRGKREIVIYYIPLEHHQNISKQFKGKDLKVTLEEAL